MTDIKESIYQYALNLSALTALIGDRFFPRLAFQDTEYPFMVYSIISDLPEQHLSGRSNLQHCVVQVITFAQSDEEAAQVSKVLEDALLSIHRGDIHGTFAIYIGIDTDSDSLLPPEDATPDGIYRDTVNYKISYRRV